jgi:hypothetical protein
MDKNSILFYKKVREVFMQSLSEQLLFTTTRLEGITPDGNSIGTGFFFNYQDRLFLITNKHVIKNTINGYFSMLRSEINNGVEKPLIGTSILIPFNESNFIGHPDKDIDVTAMNISQIYNDLNNSGDNVYRKTVSEDIIPKQEDYDIFISPIEDIIFIGYPSGLYDTKNNLPIIRRGVTASPCYYDFNGNRTFLIDASVFPGSSGSPVFIYYAGTHFDKNWDAYLGNRIYFLGIIAKVYQRQEKGVIKLIDIPTTQTLYTEINQTIDLGIVFKSDTIIETMDNYLRCVDNAL